MICFTGAPGEHIQCCQHRFSRAAAECPEGPASLLRNLYCLQARSGGSLSRSSASSEGALTWEVPAVLDRSFGPTAEAVAETAPSAAQPSVPGVAQATEAGPAAVAAGTPAAAAAVNPSSLADGGAADAAGSAGPVPSSTSASGLHPLVQLNRQECAVAAEEHMRLLLWQLLQAEEVGQADEWMPIVLRLVSESSKALLPAAAAAFGQQDPRFYVKVRTHSMQCG